MSNPVLPEVGTKIECSVCGKLFTVTASTTMYTNSGWTCSDKCFFTHHKKAMKPIWEQRKQEKAKSANKTKRIKKRKN